MQTLLLSPNFDLVFDDAQKADLVSGGVISYKDKRPLSEVSELKSDQEKILMIDPDFCDWNLTESDLDEIKNLKAVLVQTTSFSWLPVDYLASKGIPVCNIRGFSAAAVADYLVLMIFALARKLPLIIKNNYKEDFTEKFLGFELVGKTVGIIGMGTIGHEVARRCKGLGMRVTYSSPKTTDSEYERVDLDTVISESDVLVPCFAINDQTRVILSDEKLLSMKPGCLFVSPIHGVFNEELLKQLVAENKIGGAGYESTKADQEQGSEGNMLILPDHAWMTTETMKRNGQGWIANLENALVGNFPNKVN